MINSIIYNRSIASCISEGAQKFLVNKKSLNAEAPLSFMLWHKHGTSEVWACASFSSRLTKGNHECTIIIDEPVDSVKRYLLNDFRKGEDTGFTIVDSDGSPRHIGEHVTDDIDIMKWKRGCLLTILVKRLRHEND